MLILCRGDSNLRFDLEEMESNAQRRGGGSLVPISPSHTPRSAEKSMRDLRPEGGNVSHKQHDNKDKGVNVQVILRCR